MDVEDKVNRNIASLSKKMSIRDQKRDVDGLTIQEDRNDHFEHFESRNKKDMENLRRIDEGFILYFEKTDQVMDVDLHIVNLTTTWDTDYI